MSTRYFLSNTFILLSFFNYLSVGGGGVLQWNCEVMVISVVWLAAVHVRLQVGQLSASPFQPEQCDSKPFPARCAPTP